MLHFYSRNYLVLSLGCKVGTNHHTPVAAATAALMSSENTLSALFPFVLLNLRSQPLLCHVHNVEKPWTYLSSKFPQYKNKYIYLTMVFICISLSRGVERFLMYLLFVCISSLEKHLFISAARFLIGFFFFFC